MSSERGLSSDEDSLIDVEGDELRDGQASKPSKRRANLYDAVAGRVNPRGVNPIQSFASQYRDTASSGARAFRPEELLFRGKDPATRSLDEEKYFANEKLPADRPLPNSELLEAIHAYAADYFEYATADNGQDDHRTMDETALLAMGILIEEMASEELGDTGDLVLVEGHRPSEEEQEIDIESDTTTHSAARAPRRKRASSKGRKTSKRRKLARSVSLTTDAETEVDEGR
ncbi:unnamed protein product [Penicillium olsonii]|uniref:Uncharacterized protein n=1 Tax=Penicillium olsonii TaxID=99116 RepID=A0A9W4HXW2_PENOL|nr:unnamed protein product [Penicillium olsonii]CAG8184950.1 unnamed protein product [Penicillium olsonii]